MFITLLLLPLFSTIELDSIHEAEYKDPNTLVIMDK